jgi:hypothetical protein
LAAKAPNFVIVAANSRMPQAFAGRSRSYVRQSKFFWLPRDREWGRIVPAWPSQKRRLMRSSSAAAVAGGEVTAIETSRGGAILYHTIIPTDG